MNKFTIIKKGLALLAGWGAGSVVAEVAKNAKPHDLKKYEKVVYWVGGMVLSTMVSDQASKYTEDAIEKVTEGIEVKIERK